MAGRLYADIGRIVDEAVDDVQEKLSKIPLPLPITPATTLMSTSATTDQMTFSDPIGVTRISSSSSVSTTSVSMSGNKETVFYTQDKAYRMVLSEDLENPIKLSKESTTNCSRPKSSSGSREIETRFRSSVAVAAKGTLHRLGLSGMFSDGKLKNITVNGKTYDF